MKEIIESKNCKMKGKKKVFCVCAPSAKESILKAVREMGYEDTVEVVASEVNVKECMRLRDVILPSKVEVEESIKTFEKYKVGVTNER